MLNFGRRRAGSEDELFREKGLMCDGQKGGGEAGGSYFTS